MNLASRRRGHSSCRRSPGRLAATAVDTGRALAPGAAACRYWSYAGAPAELRMLRPGPRPGIPGRAYLHVRVHLVPQLRGERPARRLSELRRRARPAPHPPGPLARSRPAIDQAGCPARMRSGIRPLIRCWTEETGDRLDDDHLFEDDRSRAASKCSNRPVAGRPRVALSVPGTCANDCD